ncbi:uncharacterized protein STEHIDRAFT_117096, partial [Stereum hirsutum FP-91666 SS1]|uniref:uncharacterized protein n=1 Tax=Stereum hirsutum (strain FP-91666) TaxID=721885 RepID=UPI000440F045
MPLGPSLSGYFKSLLQTPGFPLALDATAGPANILPKSRPPDSRAMRYPVLFPGPHRTSVPHSRTFPLGL